MRRDETLESELIDVINKHIKERQLHPQEAAETMTWMAIDMIDHIAWLPIYLQWAKTSLQEALLHFDCSGQHLAARRGDGN
jgi:hypothetical protein